jgi:hypothetical protein
MYTLSRVVGVKGVKFQKQKFAQERLFHTEAAVFNLKCVVYEIPV